MKFDCNIYETIPAMLAAWKVERKAARLSVYAAAKDREFRKVTLKEGTELFLMRHIAEWLRAKGFNCDVPQRDKKMIESEDVETLDIARHRVPLPYTSVRDAANRGEFHIQFLPLGTRLVKIPALEKWHQDFFVTEYEHRGEKQTLSRWAWRYRRRMNVPKTLLLKRIRGGMPLDEALTTPVRKGE